MTTFFQDRHEAGKLLAKKLSAYPERDDVIILGLPRGGVPVAYEVAKALHVPLDLMLVRKLGVPGAEELAMGAVALPDICVFNHDVIRNYSIPDEAVERAIATENMELLRRNQLYRGGEPSPNLEDRIVILIDDGMATGANMHAAIGAAAQQQPAKIVVAVPMASEQALKMIGQQADEVVCLHAPSHFYGVGQAYKDFIQLNDETVMELLAQARHWGKGHVHFRDDHRRVSNA